MQVLAFVDVTDAWSYIGVTRLERAAATFSLMRGETIGFGFRSVQLDPGTFSRGRRLPSAWAELEGDQWVADEIAAIERAARTSGIDIDIDDAVEANSFDAHRLLAWSARSDPATQQNLIHQLWQAHFQEGADIADPLVLGSRAAVAGLDLATAERVLAGDDYADEVRTQTQAAADLQAEKLPVIMVDAQWRMDGLHSQDDYVQALDQLWSRQSDS